MQIKKAACSNNNSSLKHTHIHTVRDNDRFISLLSYRILSCQLNRIDTTLHTIIIRCIILGSIKGLLSVITEKYDLQYYIYKKQITKEGRNQQKNILRHLIKGLCKKIFFFQKYRIKCYNKERKCIESPFIFILTDSVIGNYWQFNGRHIVNAKKKRKEFILLHTRLQRTRKQETREIKFRF